MESAPMQLPTASCLALLAIVSAAQAEVYVRAPFVTVHVGQPGVYVGVFGRPVAVIANAPAVPAPRQRVSRRTTEVLPAPRPLTELDEPAPTVSEFLETFKPRRGRHEVVLVH